MRTYMAKPGEGSANGMVDAKETRGRLASEVAALLRGNINLNILPRGHGDFVIVINAKDAAVREEDVQTTIVTPDGRAG